MLKPSTNKERHFVVIKFQVKEDEISLFIVCTSMQPTTIMLKGAKNIMFGPEVTEKMLPTKYSENQVVFLIYMWPQFDLYGWQNCEYLYTINYFPLEDILIKNITLI